MSEDGPQWLLDLHEFLPPLAALPKIWILADDDAADDAKDGLENRAVAPIRRVFGNHIKATPAALDGLVEFDDCAATPAGFTIFADHGAYLSIGEVLGIKHNGDRRSGWVSEMALPAGISPATAAFEARCSIH